MKKEHRVHPVLNIGLALGSGASRGWSHVGVIRALSDLGIEPAIICGTSMGALVGASYLAGKIGKLEEWACSLTRLETARYLDINASFNGFVNTDRLHAFLNENVADDEAEIEHFTKRYAAVSTELETGREIWITKGSLVEAVWASISLPGLFPAIRDDNRWLVDGGLVNPVPVSVCRALGADVVIAVNLNGDILGRHFRKPEKIEKRDNGVRGKITDLVREYAGGLFESVRGDTQPPSLFDAIASSVNITQDRITRSRMAGDPPDLLLTPKLSHIGLLEFYRAGEAIEEGMKSVERMRSDIEHMLEMVQR